MREFSELMQRTVRQTEARDPRLCHVSPFPEIIRYTVATVNPSYRPGAIPEVRDRPNWYPPTG